MRLSPTERRATEEHLARFEAALVNLEAGVPGPERTRLEQLEIEMPVDLGF